MAALFYFDGRGTAIILHVIRIPAAVAEWSFVCGRTTAAPIAIAAVTA
jgi:hypothetical protein